MAATPYILQRFQKVPALTVGVFNFPIAGELSALGSLGRSRVGLVTLLPTPAHLKTLPIKMFEYMSAGVPIVASDFPLWREIVVGTGSGLCVDPTDPAAIAAAVDRLAEDAELGVACRRNGVRAVAGEFNWSAQARNLLKLYEHLQRQRKES